jgi:predicted DCC family thiol-disulfide oxidoreductase YuxK
MSYLAWTGGQWSFVRGLLAVYLGVGLLSVAVHSAQLDPASFRSIADLADPYAASRSWTFFPELLLDQDDVPRISLLVAVAAAGALLAVAFFFGIAERWTAVLLSVLHHFVAQFSGDEWRRTGPTMTILLFSWALSPAGAFGSFPSRGRLDPDNGWRASQRTFTFAWTALLVTIGAAALELSRRVGGPLTHPVLEQFLGFSERTLLPRAWTGLGPLFLEENRREVVDRLLLWFLFGLPPALFLSVFIRRTTNLLLVSLGILSLFAIVRGADPWFFSLFFLHLLAMDPGAFVDPAKGYVERIFYDGECGLCHRFLRFCLSEDRAGARFKFSPLQGETAARELARFGKLPDSVVLLTTDGCALTKSTAVIHVMRRLGGLWRIVAVAFAIFPAPLRDVVYDMIAGIRRRVFRKPEGLCPMMPPHLRPRFEV